MDFLKKINYDQVFKCINVIVKLGEWVMMDVNREKEAGLTMLAMAN